MKVEFHKYHGNGNDFILIDNRGGVANDFSKKTIAALCHRRFGIGADGLILLNKSAQYDFEMKYYNADGNESTMCGNGGQCMMKYARELEIIKNKATFLAIDGVHEGQIGKNGTVVLRMKDVSFVRRSGKDYIVNTGSPHYVKFAANIHHINVSSEGRKIRNWKEFAREGINVNFVEVRDGKLEVRTYERGVEDETLSCGTGVVAAALTGALKLGKKEGRHTIRVETPGGPFTVTFVKTARGFSDILLKGEAQFVFKGEIEV